MTKRTRRVNRRRSKKQRGGEQNTIERLQDFFVQKQILGTNANRKEHGQYLDHSIKELESGYGAMFCDTPEDCVGKNPIYIAPYPSLEWTVSKGDHAIFIDSEEVYSVGDTINVKGERKTIKSFGVEEAPYFVFTDGKQMASSTLRWFRPLADTKQATLINSAYDRREFAVNDYVVLNDERQKIVSFGSEDDPVIILENGTRIASGDNALNFIKIIPAAPERYVTRTRRSRKRLRK